MSTEPQRHSESIPVAPGLPEVNDEQQTTAEAHVSNIDYSNLIVDTDKRLQLLILSNYQWKRRLSPRLAALKENSMAGKQLNNFMNLPLELTCEIAKYLNPNDLLSFIRLNKRFRTVFRKRSASSIWRQVMVNYNTSLPPCPPDMSGPQYAILMFTSGNRASCMACGYESSCELRAYPTLRLRLCPRCASLNLICGHDLAATLSDVETTRDILTIVPSSDSCFYSCEDQTVTPWQMASFYYFKPEAEIIIAAYQKAKESGNLAEFIEQRKFVKNSMILQGRELAKCIDLCHRNNSSKSCCARKPNKASNKVLKKRLLAL